MSEGTFSDVAAQLALSILQVGNVRPISTNRHNSAAFQGRRMNTQNTFSPSSSTNDRQRMIQELERKLQRQQELANEIARQRAELRRLQNSGQNVGSATQRERMRSVVKTGASSVVPNSIVARTNNQRNALNGMQTPLRTNAHRPSGPQVQQESSRSSNTNGRSSSRNRQSWRRISSAENRAHSNVNTRNRHNAQKAVSKNVVPNTRTIQKNSGFTSVNINRRNNIRNRQNSNIAPILHVKSADKVTNVHQRHSHRTAVPFRNSPKVGTNSGAVSTESRIPQNIKTINRNSIPFKTNNNALNVIRNKPNTRQASADFPRSRTSDFDKAWQKSMTNKQASMHWNVDSQGIARQQPQQINQNSRNNPQSYQQASTFNSGASKIPPVGARRHAISQSKSISDISASIAGHRLQDTGQNIIQRQATLNTVHRNGQGTFDRKQKDKDNKAIFLRYRDGILQARDQQMVKVQQSSTDERQNANLQDSMNNFVRVRNNIASQNLGNDHTNQLRRNNYPAVSVINKAGLVQGQRVQHGVSHITETAQGQVSHATGGEPLLTVVREKPSMYIPVDTLSPQQDFHSIAQVDQRSDPVVSVVVQNRPPDTSLAAGPRQFSSSIQASNRQTFITQKSNELPLVVDKSNNLPTVSLHSHSSHLGLQDTHSPSQTVQIPVVLSSTAHISNPSLQTVNSNPPLVNVVSNTLPQTLQSVTVLSEDIHTVLPSEVKSQTIKGPLESLQNSNSVPTVVQIPNNPNPSPSTTGNLPVVVQQSQVSPQILQQPASSNLHPSLPVSSQTLNQPLPAVQTVGVLPVATQNLNIPASVSSSLHSSLPVSSQTLTQSLPAVQTVGVVPAITQSSNVAPLASSFSNIQLANQLSNISPMASFLNLNQASHGLGIGGLWDGGADNIPAAFRAAGITHGSQLNSAWQNWMFGDSIDPPDPPDPVNNGTNGATTEIEIETVVYASTTSAPTTTKPPARKTLITTPAPSKTTKPNIIHSIALQLADLLGKRAEETLKNKQTKTSKPVKRLSNTSIGHVKTVEVKANKSKGKQINKKKSPISEHSQAHNLKADRKIVKVDNAIKNEPPVMFLSGKIPKANAGEQTVVDIKAGSMIKTGIDPVLAGVKVNNVKAQRIVESPLPSQQDAVTKRKVGTWKMPPADNVVQPIVKLQSNALNPLQNIFPESLLKSAVRKTLAKSVINLNTDTIKQDPKVNVKSPKPTAKMVNLINNPVSFIDNLLVNESPSPVIIPTTTPQPEPVLVTDQNVLIDPPVQAAPPQDTSAVLKSALVDILSKIRHLWTGPDGSAAVTQPPMTTTTEVTTYLFC